MEILIIHILQILYLIQNQSKKSNASGIDQAPQAPGSGVQPGAAGAPPRYPNPILVEIN